MRIKKEVSCMPIEKIYHIATVLLQKQFDFHLEYLKRLAKQFKVHNWMSNRKTYQFIVLELLYLYRLLACTMKNIWDLKLKYNVMIFNILYNYKSM